MARSTWKTVPAALAALSVSSLPKYIELWALARDAGAASEWWPTVTLYVQQPETQPFRPVQTVLFFAGRLVGGRFWRWREI